MDVIYFYLFISAVNSLIVTRSAMYNMRETQLKALVVDDNEVNTLILANMLELFGVHVDQIYSGQGAVLMFQHEEYDLVFIDHVMPEMDGVQTTEKLRSIVKDKDKTAIFALTSHLTENIKCIYQGVGANDVFAKPLELAEIIIILKKWFPKLVIDESIYVNESSDIHSKKMELIQSLLKNIPEINYVVGLKYAIGNPIHYAHILKISVKDIKSCINRIIKSQKEERPEDLRIGMHNLRSLFSNIGAEELFDATRLMNRLIRQYEYDNVKHQLTDYINKIVSFNNRLENAINQYEAFEQLEEMEQEKEQYVMSEQEYEQSLSCTIYYIRSFEYDFIIKELQNLIHSGHRDLKKEFMEALEEIKDFNYDSALERMLKIKEKR